MISSNQFQQQQQSQQQKQKHIFINYKRRMVCEDCGFQKLKFPEVNGVKTGIRKNGITMTKKEDQNRFFYPREYMKFEDCLKANRKHTIKFLLNTGARINEARHVLVSDIDFTNRRMVLRITKKKATKGEDKSRIRTLPMSTQFTKYLVRYIKENKLSSDSNFNLLGKASVKIAMKKAAIESGLKNPQDFSAHTLRKTLEVWLLSLGLSNLTLVAHFGHDLRTAAHHYISADSLTWEEKQMVRNVIGDLYQRNNMEEQYLQ